jgi:hypothetical protein
MVLEWPQMITRPFGANISTVLSLSLCSFLVLLMIPCSRVRLVGIGRDGCNSRTHSALSTLHHTSSSSHLSRTTNMTTKQLEANESCNYYCKEGTTTAHGALYLFSASRVDIARSEGEKEIYFLYMYGMCTYMSGDDDTIERREREEREKRDCKHC